MINKVKQQLTKKLTLGNAALLLVASAFISQLLSLVRTKLVITRLTHTLRPSISQISFTSLLLLVHLVWHSCLF